MKNLGRLVKKNNKSRISKNITRNYFRNKKNNYNKNHISKACIFKMSKRQKKCYNILMVDQFPRG